MKAHLLQHSGGSAASQSVHKAVQNRSHGTKTGGHRYERRKIREYLRHAEIDADDLNR